MNEDYVSFKCTVCFDEDCEIIGCANIDCKAYICYDCISRFIDINKPNIIECVSKECENGYVYSTIINGLENENTIEVYKKSIVKHLDDLTKKRLSEKKSVERMIEKIRTEKKVFVATFPEAVQTVINVVYTPQLNKITKSNRKKIDKLIKKSIKKCPNLYCKGLLDLDMRCMVCRVAWCEACEKKLTPSHKCKQEDIDSINAVKECVKCPHCNFPVMRSFGCNNMTCSVCGTHFHYVTGKRNGIGNHANTKTILKSAKTLSETILYETDELDTVTIELIKRVETLHPKVDYYYKSIEKIIEEDKKKSTKLFTLYEKMVMEQSKVRKYNMFMEAIEKMYRKKKYNVNKLRFMVESLC